MNTINVTKWLAGGIVAGVVIWIVEGLARILYMEEMQAAMADHGLVLELSTGTFLSSLFVSLVVGLTLVFFYALVRNHLGASPKTAVTVAVALWVGGYLVSLIGHRTIGLFSDSMLVKWGLIGLAELVAAALVGCRIYKEG